MNRILILLLALALSTPLAVADDDDDCDDDDDDDRRCGPRVIPDTTVGAGKSKTYRGAYTATGTVVVQPGGTVTVRDAQVTFEPTSAGFVVLPGGTLNVLRTTFAESASGSEYGIQADPGSTLRVTDTAITGGSGVGVSTEDAQLARTTLSQIPVALRLTDVSITVSGNTFIDNTVAVNQTGGSPRLEGNHFQGGQICVKDWLTNPTIVHNTFRGCHIGIWHERSESTLSNNDMADEVFPPGAGIMIIDTESPIVEGNTIRNYGTGILIVNARGYLRNNTIEGNVGDGVRVERNSLPMDIQGNAIRHNGGAGIRLVDVLEVPVFGNVIEDNAGDGIVIEGASADALVADNDVRRSGGAGIVVRAPGALLDGNRVSASALDGILVTAADARIQGGSTAGNGGDGLALRGALGVTVEDLDATGNAGDGVEISGSSATFARVNASQNAANGFLYDPQGPWEILGPTDLVSVRALSNGGAGLRSIDGNATSARLSWFQGNAVGVQNDDVASLIDARESYWGHASGPRHVANPLGQGDTVVGNVLYVPFLTTPPV